MNCMTMHNPASLFHHNLTRVRRLKLLESIAHKEFIELIKNFTIPEHIHKEAVAMGFSPPVLVKTAEGLLNALLESNWRSWPMQFDVPFPSQIFGQHVAEAGIQGIKYPSKFNQMNCLAIYPQNFDEPETYVQLDDGPPKGVQVQRLDSSNKNLSKEL